MRRATLRTRHDDPETVAGAVRPDNTDEMTTAVRDGRVVTTVERETTAGLRSTVDDYVVNLRVADRAAAGGRRPAGAGDPAGDDGATGDGSDDRSGDPAAGGSDLGEQRDDHPSEDASDERPTDDPNHE